MKTLNLIKLEELTNSDFDEQCQINLFFVKDGEEWDDQVTINSEKVQVRMGMNEDKTSIDICFHVHETDLPSNHGLFLQPDGYAEISEWCQNIDTDSTGDEFLKEYMSGFVTAYYTS